ncbi:CPBP family intramembrane metalloprotease, partial [Clostridioides difficile]
ISISIIMTTFYNLNKTLIIPIAIHQLFNFLIGIINEDLIELINYYAMLYLIFAIALIVINPGNVLYKNIRE